MKINKNLALINTIVVFLLVSLVLSLSNNSLASITIQEKLSTNKYSPWSYSGFSLISNEIKSALDGGGRLSTYSYLTAAYRLGGGKRVAFRLPFTYSTAGFDDFNGESVQKQELELQDVFMSFNNYNLILLPGEIGVFWEGRVYAPTSKYSRKINLISRLRNDLIFTKYISSQWIFEMISKYNYYYQSQSAYENSFEDENGFPVTTTSLTKNTNHDYRLDLWHRNNPNFSYGVSAGWEDIYYNQSVTNSRKKSASHKMSIAPKIAFKFTSNANFIFEVSDTVDNSKNRNELGQFKAENVEITLLAFFRL